MNNEIRNELLLILSYAKATTEEDKNYQIRWLLDRFKEDIKKQLKDIEYKKSELEHNLEELEYVKKELGIEK